MSFLASTPKVPAPSQKPLGADLHRASTSEQARPVPYFAGRQRIGLTFISDVFDRRAEAVTQSIGKQKAKTGYNYFTSFAALAAHGPVDALYNIYLNGDPVYTSETIIYASTLTAAGNVITFGTSAPHGLTTGDTVVIADATPNELLGTQVITVTDAKHFTFTLPAAPSAAPAGAPRPTARALLPPIFRDVDHPDYVDIVIPNYGTMRLYWGTETQAGDAYLQTSGVAHPAMRGLCYAVFHQLFIGFNQTNVQNVELVLARYPKADWHDLGAIGEDCNPVAFIGDVLQNWRAGLGLPTAKLDTASLLATASRLVDEGLGFSPLITREQKASEFLLTALDYIDGFPVINADGQLGIGLARLPEDELPEIADDDLVAPPAFSPEDWTSAKTETNVKFTNADFGFKEDMRKWRDPAALSIADEPNLLTLDRSWVTSPAVAEAMVKSAGRAAALPALSGRLRLRQTGTLLADLAPGSMFTLNYSRRDTSNLVFRVVEQTLPAPDRPEFEITFKLDRSYLYTEVA